MSCLTDVEVRLPLPDGNVTGVVVVVAIDTMWCYLRIVQLPLCLGQISEQPVADPLQAAIALDEQRNQDGRHQTKPHKEP